MQVPYPDENSPIASHTISTAQDSGWIWDIGLLHRRGIGHVYSSRHTSEEQATERLRREHNLARDYVPLLDTHSKNADGGHSITLIDPRNAQNTLTVITRDSRFQKIRREFRIQSSCPSRSR